MRRMPGIIPAIGALLLALAFVLAGAVPANAAATGCHKNGQWHHTCPTASPTPSPSASKTPTPSPSASKSPTLSPSASPSVSPSPTSASPSPSTSASLSPTSAPSTTPVGLTLPVTGPNVGAFVAVGAVLIVAGALALVILRIRRRGYYS